MKEGNAKGPRIVAPKSMVLLEKWATNWAKAEQGQKVKTWEYSFPKLATISPVKSGSLQ